MQSSSSSCCAMLYKLRAPNAQAEALRDCHKARRASAPTSCFFSQILNLSHNVYAVRAKRQEGPPSVVSAPACALAHCVHPLDRIPTATIFLVSGNSKLTSVEATQKHMEAYGVSPTTWSGLLERPSLPLVLRCWQAGTLPMWDLL